MDSTTLEAYGLGFWATFSLRTEESVLRDLPTQVGVYAVLLPGSEARAQGISDIAYIGKATNKNGLRGRIRQYFHPGPTQSTNILMKKRLCERDCGLRLGFAVRTDVDSTRRLESDLLIQFEREHGELPPYNRQRALDLMARFRATNAG